jgi:hypothetical protein
VNTRDLLEGLGWAFTGYVTHVVMVIGFTLGQIELRSYCSPELMARDMAIWVILVSSFFGLMMFRRSCSLLAQIQSPLFWGSFLVGLTIALPGSIGYLRTGEVVALYILVFILVAWFKAWLRKIFTVPEA